MPGAIEQAILVHGPFYDAFRFMDEFDDLIAFDITHPPVNFRVTFERPFKANIELRFTASGSGTFRKVYDLISKFPTLRFEFAPAFDVEPDAGIAARLRPGEASTGFAATSEASPDNPMNDMTDDERFDYVMNHLGISREDLLGSQACIRTGHADVIVQAGN